MQQFHKFITLSLCVAQHVSGASRPSSGAYNCTCQTMANNAPTVKPEVPSAVVRS